MTGLLVLAVASTARAEPWTLQDPVSDPGDGLSILVYHDMEGLAGQDDIMSYVFGMPEYPHGQEMLAADINAVVEKVKAIDELSDFLGQRLLEGR